MTRNIFKKLKRKRIIELKKKYIKYILKKYSIVEIPKILHKKKKNKTSKLKPIFYSKKLMTDKYKPVLESFILLFLKNGKKHLSKKILIKILIELRKLLNSKLKYPLKIASEDILLQAAYNSRVVVTLQRIKMRRKFLYIPYFIRKPHKQIYYGLKLFYKELNNKSSFTANTFAYELWKLALYTSNFIQIRNELHRSVYKNRRFLKRRWPLYYTKIS